MADKKISELGTMTVGEITTGDWVAVVDSSENATKKFDFSVVVAATNFFDTVKDFYDSNRNFPDDTIVGTRSEGFSFKAIPASTSTSVFNFGGQNFEVLAGRDGVVANAYSKVRDESALAAAFAALSTTSLPTLANKPKFLTAYDDWVCNATISELLPDFGNTHFDFRGMSLEAKHNGVLFDFNPSVDWSSINTQRDYTVNGGAFENTNSSKTTSEAFRLYGLRNLTIRDAFIRGFDKAIVLQGKDTYSIENTYLQGNNYSIYAPSGLVQNGGDVLISVNINNVHISGTDINGSSDSNRGPVFIDDRVIGLWFTKSSINGNSPAQAQLRVYNNSATAVAGRAVHIDKSHFEQIGQFGAVDIHGNAAPIKAVSISHNQFQQTFDNASRCIRLRNVKGAEINNNWLEANGSITVARGIQLDSDCEDIKIGLDNQWDGTFTTKVDLFGCPRNQVTIGEGKRYFDPEALTGFDANTWSTSTSSVNVDSLWSNYSDLWLYPKGYIVRLVASDSGSASGTASALVHDGNEAAGTGSIKSGIKVDLSGTPNGTEKMVDGFVTSNNLGRLKYDFTATGASTLTVSVIILGVVE